MIAKQEIHTYRESVRVWAGKYRNSHNLLHWHGDCELIYVEQGSLEIFCEKKNHVVHEGESFLIDDEQVHSMRPYTQNALAIVIFFDKNILPPPLKKYRFLCPKLCNHYDIPKLYAQLRTVFSSESAFFGVECELLLLHNLLLMFRNEETCMRSESKSSQSLKRLLLEIDENYEFYTFQDAVNTMHMSPAYFSRYFHDATGLTFSQYLNYVRVDHAVAILNKNRRTSITEVATRCGFSTIRNFNRIFKELTGYAPRDLPSNFLLGNTPLTSETTFNPTIVGCELVESLN